MLKKLTLSFSLMILLLLASCTPPAATASTVATPPSLPDYNGPKASIVVASFECKAAKCLEIANPYIFFGDVQVSAIGNGISDAFITTLVQSKRFDVYEAAGNLAVLEGELSVTGSEDAFQGADLAIIGTITSFEPDASGTSGGGFLTGIFGGLGQQKATASMDVRVIEVASRKIVAVTKVQGEATSTSGLGGAFLGPVGGAMSTYANTPMEEAVAVMLNQAAIDLSKNIPQEYFKY
jgi:curli biogenesis system outer membrane secretion channel CsgG